MKPILFNGDMVRAILDNRKTVTRRVVKPAPMGLTYEDGSPARKPPYRPGDILYVRETWYYESHMEDMTAGEPDLPFGAYSRRYIFKADFPDYPVNVGVGQHGWRPSIHMPREAARIFLRVTDVRVERLQDCGNMQSKDEGCYCCSQFARVWDSTMNPKDRALYGWEANPWVWVIEFEKISKEEATK